MQSTRSLLHEIVDYAGLFPPTGWPMDAAVAEYARQRAGEHAWMLASFVVPASRLEEFAGAASSHRGDGAWPLSVLLGADPAADLDALDNFLGVHGPAGNGQVELRALEFRPAAPEAIAAVVDRAPSVELFAELPWGENLEPWTRELARAGAKAKIRCGGVTPDLIPPPDRVAAFLRACHDAGVGAKFTAGLHHPVRSVHPLTYEDDAPRAMMHGFLNVFVAAALVAQGAPDLVLLAVLEETDPSAFRFDDDGLAWRDQRVDAAAVAAARSRFERSFGSCSFAEPVDDLQQLGLP